MAALHRGHPNHHRGNCPRPLALPWSRSFRPPLKAWPRVAGLCVFVYGVFFLLTLFGFAILLLVATGTPSLALASRLVGASCFCRFVMFGRAFVNFLYWQQPAVLEETGLLESLKRSERARPQPTRIALVASAVMAWGRSWPPSGSSSPSASASARSGRSLAAYFQILTTLHDPEAIMQAMSAAAKSAELSPVVARPRSSCRRSCGRSLGISFVLVYLEI